MISRAKNGNYKPLKMLEIFKFNEKYDFTYLKDLNKIEMELKNKAKEGKNHKILKDPEQKIIINLNYTFDAGRYNFSISPAAIEIFINNQNLNLIIIEEALRRTYDKKLKKYILSNFEKMYYDIQYNYIREIGVK